MSDEYRAIIKLIEIAKNSKDEYDKACRDIGDLVVKHGKVVDGLGDTEIDDTETCMFCKYEDIDANDYPCKACRCVNGHLNMFRPKEESK